MPPASYRLDTVALRIIERSEGARRTWLDAPDTATERLARIAQEVLEGVVREHDALLGESGWGERLQQEIRETFLPRLSRLVIAHNALEATGYGAWRGGDPAARVLGTGAALLGALVLERLLHHPLTLLAFFFALLVPIMPEIRAWYYRRAYRQALQQAVDDMARIQGELDLNDHLLPPPTQRRADIQEQTP